MEEESGSGGHVAGGVDTEAGQRRVRRQHTGFVKCSVCGWKSSGLTPKIDGRRVQGELPSYPRMHYNSHGAACSGVNQPGVSYYKPTVASCLEAFNKPLARPSVCNWCHKDFAPSYEGEEFCGAPCNRASRLGNASVVADGERDCMMCGKRFMPTYQFAHRCKECRTPPKGYFIYAWHEDERIFYIGLGQGWRMTEKHTDASSPDNIAPCERHRRTIGDRFSVKVVRDNLTDEGARLVEGVLINLLEPEYNRKAGHNRRERLPLTLPTFDDFGGVSVVV